MPEIAWPISTVPGINPTESGGRLINAFCDLAPPGSRSKFAWRAVPGLRNIGTEIGSATHRGAIKLSTQLVTINGDKALLTTKSGTTYTPVEMTGTVPGSGPVIMARNMRSTPQIMVVHSDGVTKIESGAATDFSDVDLPQPNSVCFHDGYFIFGIGDGRMFASGLNADTIADTDFTTAEAKPDGITRVYSTGESLVALGEVSTEFYSNTGNAEAFPFTRAAVIPVGLAGPYAIAGGEEGFPNPVGFVAHDRTVRLLVGYEAVKISPPDLDHLLAQIEDTDTIECSVYVTSGRSVLVVSCDDWTWEYCFAAQDAPAHWRERKSLGIANWRAHFGVNVFGEWLTFDKDSAKVFRLDPTFRREDDEQLVWEMRSAQAHRFPGRVRGKRTSFDIRTGVGIDGGIDPIESDPVVAISWSDDGGVTFGLPVIRSLGTQGEIRNIDVFRPGLTGRFGRQYKLRIADPVSIALYGAAHDLMEKAA